MIKCQPRSWFKGADTYAVLKFLEYKLQLVHANDWELYRSCMHKAVKAANLFLSTLYKSGLWMKPSEASFAVKNGMGFCLHYRECSEMAFREGKTRFKLPPKFHAYVHIVHGILEQVGKLPRSILDRDVPSILSPLCQS